MMQKLWQQKLKLKYKEVIDIVQFGSSVIEGTEPNDIDVAVIFNKIPIKEQILEAQKIKKELQKISKLPIHIKPFDLYSLFEKSNFAKDDILFYGKSLITGDSFSKKFGLNSRLQISYSLNNLRKKDKIRFNYMLNGKMGQYGLLRKHQGNLLNPGLIEISPEYKNIFVLRMKSFKIKFNAKKVFDLS